MKSSKIYKFPKDGVKVKLSTEIPRKEYFLEVYNINDKTDGKKCVTYRACKREGYIGTSYNVGEAERNKAYIGTIVQGSLEAAVSYAAEHSREKLNDGKYSKNPNDEIGFIRII